MSAKVFSIIDRSDVQAESLDAMLAIADELRAGIQDGTVSGFALAKIKADGTNTTQWSASGIRIAMLGAITALQVEFVTWRGDDA